MPPAAMATPGASPPGPRSNWTAWDGLTYGAVKSTGSESSECGRRSAYFGCQCGASGLLMRLDALVSFWLAGDTYGADAPRLGLRFRLQRIAPKWKTRLRQWPLLLQLETGRARHGGDATRRVSRRTIKGARRGSGALAAFYEVRSRHPRCRELRKLRQWIAAAEKQVALRTDS